MRKLKLRMPAKYDRILHGCIIALILFGSLMIASTSVGLAYDNKMVVVRTIAKQFAFVIVAYLTMVALANTFVLEKMTKIERPIGFLILALLGACLFFIDAGGARSWIRFNLPFLGQMSIQPSEFMKVFLIVNMASVVNKIKRRNIDCWSIVKMPFSFFMIAAIIILFQNDMGSLIVMSLICAICLLIPSHPNLKKFQKRVTILLVVGSCLVIFLASDWGISILQKFDFLQEYVIKRFEMAQNPWLDETDKGYQLINSLYAFATGGWRGLGLGHSIQKMSYLPAASTDYILAVIVEEWGISGYLIVLGLYSTVLFRLFKYALLSKKEGYKILYIGTSLYLFIHFVFNVGGVTGLIPLTGIPLLFMSSGASSLVSICMAMGICQAAISKENLERAEI